MFAKQKSRHFLAQLYPGNEDLLGSSVRKVDLLARAIYPSRHGIKSFSSLQVRLIGIDEQGARLQASALQFLPEHFYLCLGDEEIFFTCGARTIVRDTMFVTFAQAESRAVIDALAGITQPRATLLPMRGRCGPVLEGRMVRMKRGQPVSH